MGAQPPYAFTMPAIGTHVPIRRHVSFLATAMGAQPPYAFARVLWRNRANTHAIIHHVFPQNKKK